METKKVEKKTKFSCCLGGGGVAYNVELVVTTVSNHTSKRKCDKLVFWVLEGQVFPHLFTAVL